MQLRGELPDFSGINQWINGQVTKAELAGSPVLVHFWSVSCHACRETMPNINGWRENYAANGLSVIGIHMPCSDSDTDMVKIKRAIAEQHLTHPIAIDHDRTTVDAFQNEYVPAFYLFDEKLQLRHFHAGEKGLNLVKKRLLRILGIEEES